MVHLQSVTLSPSRGGRNKKKTSWMKTLECRRVLQRCFKAPFSTADRIDVFFTRDPGSNLCHYQSARLSWCHPDAPSWNTHRLLCLHHLRFRLPLFLFFFFFARLHLTHTQIHACLYRLTKGDAHFGSGVVLGWTRKTHLLCEVDAAVKNKQHISYFTWSLTVLACSRPTLPRGKTKS